jgi:WD40 repeat protein
VRLYDVLSQNPNPITTFEGHTKNVTAIQFQSQGRWFVTSSEDGTIKIFDVRTLGIQRDYSPKIPTRHVHQQLPTLLQYIIDYPKVNDNPLKFCSTYKKHVITT